MASDPGGEKKAHLYAVASAGTKAIVAVGEDGTIRVSPNNGQHWVDHTIKDIRDDFLAVALNASQNWGIAVGDDGLVAANRLNFQNWYLLDKPTAERLNAVVIDQHSNTTLAAGEGGTIVASSDQGSTWTFIERKSPNEINALAFDGQIALFAGEYATLLRGEVPEGKDARDMQVDVISSGFEQRQKKEMLGRQRHELEDLIRDLTELEEKAAKEAQDMQDDLSQYIFFQTNALRISVLVVLMFLSQHLMILMRYRWRLGEFYYARANAMKMTSHAVAWSALSAHEFDVIIRALSPDAVELGRTPRSAVEMGIDFAKSVMRRTD
ncbi:MAG: hypothetical protein OXI15_19620 [Chromatiales bacterium]|nr:hypothetical protein [Chromatiales bacterium]